MSHRYRVFRRGWGTLYCQDLTTGKQESFRTRDKTEAHRLVAARNESEQAPAFSLQLARVYWRVGDPAAANRTWQGVMDEVLKQKTGPTRERWAAAIKEPPSTPSAIWSSWKPGPSTSSVPSSAGVFRIRATIHAYR